MVPGRCRRHTSTYIYTGSAQPIPHPSLARRARHMHRRACRLRVHPQSAACGAWPACSGPPNSHLTPSPSHSLPSPARHAAPRSRRSPDTFQRSNAAHAAGLSWPCADPWHKLPLSYTDIMHLSHVPQPHHNQTRNPAQPPLSGSLARTPPKHLPPQQEQARSPHAVCAQCLGHCRCTVRPVSDGDDPGLLLHVDVADPGRADTRACPGLAVCRARSHHPRQ